MGSYPFGYGSLGTAQSAFNDEQRLDEMRRLLAMSAYSPMQNVFSQFAVDSAVDKQEVDSTLLLLTEE